MISTATSSKEEILKRLGEHFAETLFECLDYVHTKDIAPDDIAKLIIDELEDWMAYHASMTNAADSVRNALRERVS
jgi:predicted small metal-binding protein